MTHRTPQNLDWMPVGRVVAMRAAGDCWDAVRVPRRITLTALGQLGDHTGAVIEDPGGSLFYWLIPPGTASSWEFNADAQIQILGETTQHVAVPGPQRTAGPHWRVPPTRVRCLTEPGTLKAALYAAVRDACGPRAGADHRGYRREVSR